MTKVSIIFGYLLSICVLACIFAYPLYLVTGAELESLVSRTILVNAVILFYPLCLLAVDSIWQKRTGVLWLGVCYAGLVLSHNISALIFSPFLLLYII